jgi:BirA family biotin operon repressor/biotin-[acetyl-CoA-carboxylase] ligase
MQGYRRIALSNPFGGPVLHLPETGSVMEDAARAERPWPPGTVLFTDHQHSGRGRGAGRSWEAAPGTSLLMALILERTANRSRLSTISLRTALALAWYLEELGAQPQIKWPNDLLVEGRKLSGVLCEVGSGSVRVGVGLNCLQTRFPAGLRRPAGSVVLETGLRHAPRVHLERLLPHLMRSYQTDELVEAAERRLYLMGEEAVLLEGSAEKATAFVGSVAGLQDDGALLFRSGGTVRPVYTGELRAPGAGE